MSDIAYGTRRAINELLAIFSCQWRNGMLPQIRFTPGQQGYRPDADDWGVTEDITGPTALRTSGITQPPIIGLCTHEVFRKINYQAQAGHYGDFLAISNGLERYHDWLFRERDPWGENLVLCLHPWETGTDNSPAFDPLIAGTHAYIEQQGISVDGFGRADTVHVKRAHRPSARDYFSYFGLVALFKTRRYEQRAIIEDSPFLLQDVLFNSLLAASLLSLAELQSALASIDVGKAARLVEQAGRNRERANAVSAAIRRKLWHERDGFFYSYDVRGEGLLSTPTVSAFMPLSSGIANDEQAERITKHLLDPSEFWTNVPIPSTAANSPDFNPERYWSGPSWPVTNWLVWRSLCERGLPFAETLRQSTLAMISEGSDLVLTREAALRVMERNSFGEAFTTPSTRQYQHAWLWDSAIVASSWPLVSEKPDVLPSREGEPGFWEYYQPHTGAPLGASHMTWTASLFLELQNHSISS
ncbi:MAG TPA: trehalase family glycosidase [Chloroflexia bacterium]|nr:trehalase family glycosidase [Chloroflexia bacterium]